jgi:hypothetical protein
VSALISCLRLDCEFLSCAQETAEPNAQIRTTSFFILTDRIAKVLIGGFAAFFSNRPTGQLILTLVVVAILLVVTVQHRPCRDIAAINVLRVVMYSMAIWSLISSLGTSLSTSVHTAVVHSFCAGLHRY